MCPDGSFPQIIAGQCCGVCPRRKILCLHGGNGTAIQFRNEIYHIVQALPQFEFVFAQGGYPGGSGRLWVPDPPGGKNGGATTSLTIDSQSYNLLDSTVQQSGPFAGILGYSQGAMYVSAYLAHAPANTFQFAVMFCGYLPTTHLGLLSRINAAAPFTLPAYIFMGVNDQTIRNGMTQQSVTKYANRTVVVSSAAAHNPPASNDPTFGQLTQWVSLNV
jgi:predicted esterase